MIVEFSCGDYVKCYAEEIQGLTVGSKDRCAVHGEVTITEIRRKE